MLQILQVTDQIVAELLQALKEEGVSVEGKEESIRAKFSGTFFTQLCHEISSL
jgi:hypothetical protein